MLASSVQAVVVCNATAPRVYTLVLFIIIEAATAMNLGVFTLAVCALALLTTSTAQLGDCELSDLFNGVTLETQMPTAITSGFTPSPVVTVLRNHTVCLSVGPTKDKFSSISLVIEYTCTGNDAFCPSGQAVEQFDFGCNIQGEWSYIQFSDVDNGRTTNPVANFDTTLRMDCGACFPVHPNQEDPPIIDPVTHCQGRPHTVLLASESYCCACSLQSAEDAVTQLDRWRAMDQSLVNAAMCT